jgi:type VI secretion system protein ImpF
MPEINQERLQPCLFDRLTDENPEVRQDSRSTRVISLQRYRDGVLRDLRWLLNAKAHLEPDVIQEFGEVRRSVLNYGMRDLAGMLSSDLDPGEIEHQIKEAILDFEPRIMPNTLMVRALGESVRDTHNPNVIAIEITGELWATPLPEQLFLQTQIDLDTGECLL